MTYMSCFYFVHRWHKKVQEHKVIWIQGMKHWACRPQLCLPGFMWLSKWWCNNGFAPQFLQHCTVPCVFRERSKVEFIRVINITDGQVWVQRGGWKSQQAFYLKPGLWVQVHANRWRWASSDWSCDLARQANTKAKSVSIVEEMKD